MITLLWQPYYCKFCGFIFYLFFVIYETGVNETDTESRVNIYSTLLVDIKHFLIYVFI